MSLSARRMVLALVTAGAALALATDQPSELHCPMNATKNQCKEYTDSTFRMNGNSVEFIYKVKKSLTLKCTDDQQLDSEQTLRWLPRFTPALHVGNVTVEDCLPVHYATVLAALNVTTTSPFNLELSGTRGEPLDDTHFTDLHPLRHLTIRYTNVPHSLLASLESLTTLTMVGTLSLVDDTVLEALPRSLTKLRLKGVDITRVPTTVLDLPKLRSLYMEVWHKNDVVLERGNASRLQQLHVSNADAALMSDWAPPALEEVTLEDWRAKRPNPLPACDKLVKLTLISPFVSDLPAGWVARCPRLEELHIERARNLEKLPAGLLENATQLTSISIRSTTLSSLPAQLFADTPHLTHLDLYGNQLKQLPSSMLTLPLLSLNLGFNGFDTSVVAELATFTELKSLSLLWNQGISDLCAVNDSNVPEYKMKSSLVALSKLERLELYSTNVSVICSDWLEDMVNLEFLDLGETKVDNLTYEDLQYKRSVPAVVELTGTIYFTADDYDRAAAAAVVAPPSHNVTVILNAYGSYNCTLYWIREALSNDLLPLRDVQLFGTSLSLRTVRVKNPLCPSEETCATVPGGCNCGMAGGGLLRVVCVSLELDRVLLLPSLVYDLNAIDLVLVNNSITELVLNDLPYHLRVLDLRNNLISYMTETTASALVSGSKRRVLLAGNRLECSCRATPALRVLRDHVAVLVGYEALRCEDGRTFEQTIDACWTLTTIVIVALLPTVTAATLGLWLRWKWRYVLGHTRASLWRLGWRSCDERDAAAEAWLWDAFVMFGRGDERPALEMTARLEHGPRPRRVSLAERDWLPPALLTECITLSARTARCTVALVSRECERSLETDEIHAVARRGALVLVLPPAGELEDAALGRYATDYPHMVLRRNTPDFWRRLERVVPASPPTPASPPIPACPLAPPSEYIPLVLLTPHR